MNLFLTDPLPPSRSNVIFPRGHTKNSQKEKGEEPVKLNTIEFTEWERSTFLTKPWSNILRKVVKINEKVRQLKKRAGMHISEFKILYS